ncbi:hypothetical protein WA026_012056 [Henosepilachna vigintioctopunctata]|uniref:Cytochrome P450 n=1 Tax=Henosepilachna vigintioctopunctata TaxID=420089 RepID=A0AAW1VD18_9CUCU
MMWLVLLLIIFAILYIYMKRSLSYWENKNVVFEKPSIIFGNFINAALRKEQLGYTLKRLYDQMDDTLPYFGVYVFHSPYLVVKSRDMIKQVLIKNFSSFINRTEYSNVDVDPFSSNVLFSLKNDIWKTTRTKLSPIFTSGKMKLMLPLMKEVTNEMDDILNEMEGKEIDVRDLSKRYSVDIISSCAFGINAGSLKDANSEMKTMVTRMLDQRGFTRSFAVFAWFFCPILVDIFRIPFIEKESSQYLAEVFKQSMKKRKENNTKRNDLIDMLNELKEEEAQNDQFEFDDIFMSAQAIAFFNAGTEGASILMTLSLYEMALNPDIQKELRKEIRQNIDTDGSLSYENLFGMEYLDLVVKGKFSLHK